MLHVENLRPSLRLLTMSVIRKGSGNKEIYTPVIVGHSDCDFSILRTVIVRMAYEGTLPMIVEVAVRDCDTSDSVSQVKKTCIGG